MKWFHNHYYANHICGTKGSDIDDARGPASELQEHDCAGALAPKEAAVVSSMVMPSLLSFRIGRDAERLDHVGSAPADDVERLGGGGETIGPFVLRVVLGGP